MQTDWNRPLNIQWFLNGPKVLMVLTQELKISTNQNECRKNGVFTFVDMTKYILKTQAITLIIRDKQQLKEALLV